MKEGRKSKKESGSKDMCGDSTGKKNNESDKTKNIIVHGRVPSKPIQSPPSLVAVTTTAAFSISRATCDFIYLERCMILKSTWTNPMTPFTTTLTWNF